MINPSYAVACAYITETEYCIRQSGHTGAHDCRPRLLQPLAIKTEPCPFCGATGMLTKTEAALHATAAHIVDLGTTIETRPANVSMDENWPWATKEWFVGSDANKHGIRFYLTEDYLWSDRPERARIFYDVNLAKHACVGENANPASMPAFYAPAYSDKRLAERLPPEGINPAPGGIL